MITNSQKKMARHALGLPNNKRTSSRNRFVCPDADPHWCNMVENGLATVRKGETLPFGDSACFYLTRAGAEAALEPREKLSREDFPVIQTRPILFSAPMIRALMNGQKTQTRRILKTQPQLTSDGLIECGSPLYSQRPDSIKRLIKNHVRFAVGDRLWVREAWRCNGWATDVAIITYKAHERCGYTEMTAQIPLTNHMRIEPSGRWKPSIFMPRWISRITLTVTDVRIQRVQDISEEDAIAEGVPLDTSECDHPLHSCYEVGCLGKTNKAAFCNTWCEINGLKSWDQNPWVTALTFTVEKRNIDQVPA